MKAIKDFFTKKKVCSYLVQHEGDIVRRYGYFKNFLDDNHAALNLIAELEQLYHSGQSFSLTTVRRKTEDLMRSIRSLVRNIDGIARGRYAPLLDVVNRIEQDLVQELQSRPFAQREVFVLPFGAITPEVYDQVGAKAGNLASAANILGLPVPAGFVVTAYSFRHFLSENGLLEPIAGELARLSTGSGEDMERTSERLRKMVLSGRVPETLAREILRAYEELEEKTHKGVRIAMRSSAVGEDTGASFAGQYHTVLNVTRENLLDAYRRVLAGKYNARAIFYRLQNGLEDEETPMCVAGVAMVDAKASGVAYTVDPSSNDASIIKINSIWGLGELLVSGETSPDILVVDKKRHVILDKEISRKEKRLTATPDGRTEHEEVPENQKTMPSIDDSTAVKLSHYATMLEEFFKGPQDIEWAVDAKGHLFILQSRPLGVSAEDVEDGVNRKEYPDHPVVFSGGKTASTGVAAGRVFLADEANLAHLPDNAILVARTAAPEYARLMTKVAGIVTDLGSVASHLASVAREFGVPALVDAKEATVSLNHGDVVTLNAGTATAYSGLVQELIESAKETRKNLSQSPLHRRMRRILDRISPLNLTDPNSPSFSPEGCRTVHDIIRFSHEKIMKEMFLMSESAQEDIRSQRLTANIPLFLYFIDLGGGLKEGLTTCDAVTPEDIESIPMKALWKGLSHPGINWSSAMGFTVTNFARVMASGAMTEFTDEVGTDSYALVSKDYLNLSAKFGYHFANLDILCTNESTQNYINFQFSGGLGTYYGRSLRVLLLSNILERMGFEINNQGDYLGAFLSGHDCETIQEKLDHMGRLLACSRLLDMALRHEGDVERLTKMFFDGDYDFLAGKSEDHIQNFYIHEGHWRRIQANGHVYCLQDGSREVDPLSSGFTCVMGSLTAGRYRTLLDNIKAYHYFALAIAKESDVSEGEISVKVKCVGGCIDMAGGLAFAIRNAGSYFVLRIDALKNNVILFQFDNKNKAMERARVEMEIDPDRWYTLTVKMRANSMEGYVDGAFVVRYQAESPFEGFVGLWSKADSSTYFDDLVIKTRMAERRIPF